MTKDGFQKRGYIKVYRDIDNNCLWLLEPFTKAQAWLDLLLLTNHKKDFMIVKNGSVVPVERGQCGYSILALAKRWKWSRGKVTRYFKLLNDLKMIQQNIVENHSLITIINYEFYQGEQQTTQQTEQQVNQQTSQQAEQQTTQQTDTNKNDNNVKNDNNEKKKNFVAKSFFQKLIAEDEQLKKHSLYKDIFIEFLEYKTAIKKQYKTENSVRNAFLDFVRLSQNDINYARALVDNAIAKGWQAIYDLPREARQAFQKSKQEAQKNNENYGGF